MLERCIIVECLVDMVYNITMRNKIVFIFLIVVDVLAGIWGATVVGLPPFKEWLPIANILLVSELASLGVAVLVALPGRRFERW